MSGGIRAAGENPSAEESEPAGTPPGDIFSVNSGSGGAWLRDDRFGDGAAR